MRNNLKFSAIGIVFIVILNLVGLSGLVLAEDSPKGLNLDLSLPPRKKADEQDELIEEKYRQIMEEITISEEAKEIAEHIKAVITAVEDISLEVVLTEIGERSGEMVLKEVIFKAFYGIEQKLARLEFLEPSALRGHIFVIDQEKMESKMFRPVVNRIEVQGLEDVSKEALSALSLGDITSYFDFTQYRIAVLDSSECDGVTDYLLQVDSSEEETLQVRVRDDSWLPHEIVVFEGGVLAGRITLRNIVLNSGLESADLKKLPDVKEVRM